MTHTAVVIKKVKELYSAKMHWMGAESALSKLK